jgi:hypothetical protein
MRIQEGNQNDRFRQSLADKYVPKPSKPKPPRPPRDDSIINLPQTNTPIATLTETPTNPSCSIPSGNCATYIAVQATNLAWYCDNGGLCIGAPLPTSTPYPTTTPFLYGPVNTAVSSAGYCFERPSGGPGCGEMYDQVAISSGILPPVGSFFDGAVGGYYVAYDAYNAYNDWNNYISSFTPVPTSLTPTPSATQSSTYTPTPSATPTLFFSTPTITTPSPTQTPYWIAP